MKRKVTLPPPKKIIINSVIDIKKILEAFDPSADKKTMLGKCLLDGFEMIKRHQDLDVAATMLENDPDLYGGFVPAVPPKNTDRRSWLDDLIHTQMGGHREGLKVVWETGFGTYAFDPWTFQLEKVL